MYDGRHRIPRIWDGKGKGSVSRSRVEIRVLRDEDLSEGPGGPTFMEVPWDLDT